MKSEMEERIDNTNNCTVSDLAGYCSEMTAWRLLHDIAGALSQMQGSFPHLAPLSIAVTEEGAFQLLGNQAAKADSIYDAPECQKDAPTSAGAVWSLAATTFYAVMGCNVMNGKGGAAQQPQSKVPYMRSEMADLSVLVQRCLDYEPTQRPTPRELFQTAASHLERWHDRVRSGPRLRPPHADSLDRERQNTDSWPEEMVSL